MLLIVLLEGVRRVRDERGAVATEYGLILTLVVLVTVLAITVFGIAVSDLFDRGTEPF
ncbi:MAG TPA: Flp family type IVb pilin [Actinomycetota bacterium]|nr:Flp family type IVb pilin [Actinomycetota bacterium]